MTDEATADVAAIRARINEIECVLFGNGAYLNDNILSANAAALNREHEQRFELLRRERLELLAKLPPTGMASGQRLVIAATLGSIDLRDWPESPPVSVEGPIDIWDWSEP